MGEREYQEKTGPRRSDICRAWGGAETEGEETAERNYITCAWRKESGRLWNLRKAKKLLESKPPPYPYEGRRDKDGGRLFENFF